MDEETKEALQNELEELRNYVNCEVHQNCEYSIYVFLTDKLDSLESIIEE